MPFFADLTAHLATFLLHSPRTRAQRKDRAHEWGAALYKLSRLSQRWVCVSCVCVLCVCTFVFVAQRMFTFDSTQHTTITLTTPTPTQVPAQVSTRPAAAIVSSHHGRYTFKLTYKISRFTAHKTSPALTHRCRRAYAQQQQSFPLIMVECTRRQRQ